MKKIPFNKLSKVNKRKRIAEDALEQLKLGKMDVKEAYGYVSIDGYLWTQERENEELQQVIKEEAFSCTVCALGAILIADVIERDDLSVIKADSYEGEDIVQRLEDYFPKNNLRLIETAFELSVVNTENPYLNIEPSTWYDATPTEIAKKAIRFGKKFSNATNRLKAILNNIIDNGKGLFDPEN